MLLNGVYLSAAKQNYLEQLIELLIPVVPLFSILVVVPYECSLPDC